MLNWYHLSGTLFEGGGGLIRDALAYASLLNIPLQIHNIRANRPGRGGLRSEHAVTIATLARLANADIVGNETASRELRFQPHALPRKDSLLSSIDVALVDGAAPIFMVAMLPYVLFSQLEDNIRLKTNVEPSGLHLNLRGGTLNLKAPSFAYMEQVFVPNLGRIGLGGHVVLDKVHEEGWHSDLGSVPGSMTVYVKPLTEPLPAFILPRRGRLVKIVATAHAPESEGELFKRVLDLELGKFLETIGSNGPHPSLVITVEYSQKRPWYHLLLVGSTLEPEANLGYEQLYPQKDDPFSDELLADPCAKLTYITRVSIKGLSHELQHGNSVDEHSEVFLTTYQTLASGFSSIKSSQNSEAVQKLGFGIPDGEQM